MLNFWGPDLPQCQFCPVNALRQSTLLLCLSACVEASLGSQLFSDSLIQVVAKVPAPHVAQIDFHAKKLDACATSLFLFMDSNWIFTHVWKTIEFWSCQVEPCRLRRVSEVCPASVCIKLPRDTPASKVWPGYFWRQRYGRGTSGIRLASKISPG